MFNKEYKNAMNSIIPSDDAINRTLDALQKETQPKRRINFKNVIRVAAIACVCIALIATSVFTAFHISDIWGEYSDIETSTDTSDFLYNDEIENSDGNTVPITIEGVKQASSYEEISELLKNYYSNTNGGVFDDFWVEREEEILLEGTMKPNTDNQVPGNEIHDEPSEEPMEEPSETPEHSETNNQVKDVEEADIVKTDGKYIYYSNNNNKKINIVKINGTIMEEVSSIKFPEKEALLEMVLFEDKLLVLTQGYSKNSITYSYYYDITDRANPKETAKLSQDGYYLTSRTINGTVYIITSHYSHLLYRDDEDDGYYECIPECNGIDMEPDNILIPENIDSSSFTIITAYNTNQNGKEFKSQLSFLGASDILYATTDNIYLTKYVFIDGKTTDSGIYQYTNIFRIALNGKELVVTGKATVPGRVLNQFSMDEKDGCLRIATNIYRYDYSQDRTHVGQIEYNKVFCLDNDMKIIGESDMLGIDEEIKSVRYIGDIAYVVTFRQTDPLYAVDLSDPTDLKTLSELKIDGFSTYMHPYGSDYLIGIGFDADPKTGWTTGIKVTVFDVSDPKNIFDICTYVLSNEDNKGFFNFSPVYNHKAALIDYKKGIIGIPLTRETIEFNSTLGYQEYKTEIGYIFFDFDGKNITEKALITFNNEFLYKFTENIRAIYIGENAYIVSESGIICMDLKEYTVVSELKFG